MKIKILTIIISSLVLVASVITTTVVLYNHRCPNCEVPPPNNNGNNITASIWAEVFFTLINESVWTIKNFEGHTLLLEFAKSDCPDCSSTIPELRKLQEYIVNNTIEVTILTLMIDINNSKNLLTFYINNNLTWKIGWCNQGNYSKLNFGWVPTFYAFNSTSQLIKQQIGGTMDFNALKLFLDI